MFELYVNRATSGPTGSALASAPVVATLSEFREAARSTGAQSESWFIVGIEPAQAEPLLFAVRNVAVDSDQFAAHGCASAAAGISAATSIAPATPVTPANPFVLRMPYPLSFHGPLMDLCQQ
jgi:hypothetical protein